MKELFLLGRIVFGGYIVYSGINHLLSSEAMAQYAALCIAVFLVGVSPVMHNFWDIPDPAQRMAEMINFTKNMALLGGVLMLLGIPRPWPYSLEGRRPIAA